MENAQAAGSSTTVTVHATKDHGPGSHFWVGNSFSFHDVLDAINPLQHLPVIGTVYRHFTGDKIGNVAEVVGDGIYGGLLGLASGALNVAVKEMTGKDIGENLIALVEGDDSAAASAPAPTPSTPQARPPSAPPAPQPKPPVAAVADAQAPAQETATPGAVNGTKPLPIARGFLPIDTSDRGIMAMRATAATHNQQPVPLNLPPGTQLVSAAAPPAPVDFAAKMREGLDKYQAMLAAEAKAPAAVNQAH